MKKYVVLALAVWISLIVALTFIWQNDADQCQSKTYKIEINRINNGLSKIIVDDMTKAEAYIIEQIAAYDSITSIKFMSKFDKGFDDFISSENIRSNQLNFLPIVDSPYVVRYEINEDMLKFKDFYIYSVVVITLLFVFLFFVFSMIYVRVLRPSKIVAKIPHQLAKGHLSYRVEQDKYGYYREFLWGLDMLREVLQEEKNKNLALEKQRKILVASLSHDIKTPLSSIQNYSRAILDGVYEEDKEIKKALKVILDKSLVIEKLTKELLDSSKSLIDNLEVKLKEHYTYDLMDELNHLIHQKIDLLKIEYNSEVPIHNWLLSIDMDRMIEIADNIIENAIKYGDGKWIELKAGEEEGCLLITIENSGEPVSERELKYIFTSFYRGSNTKDKSGHGLGLYITKKLMKAMDGDVYATNTDQGFSVSIVIKII